jgi:hypothetical protein
MGYFNKKARGVTSGSRPAFDRSGFPDGRPQGLDLGNVDLLGLKFQELPMELFAGIAIPHPGLHEVEGFVHPFIALLDLEQLHDPGDPVVEAHFATRQFLEGDRLELVELGVESVSFRALAREHVVCVG